MDSGGEQSSIQTVVQKLEKLVQQTKVTYFYVKTFSLLLLLLCAALRKCLHKYNKNV